MIDQQPESHPIGLIVDDDLKRSRLTVFFRLLLAIPLAIWLAIWGIAVYVAVLIAWFVALFTGRLPEGLHEFIARYLRALTHLSAYLLLLADPWPPFGGAPGAYPVDLRVDPAASQSRLTVFFRAAARDPGAVPLLRLPAREPGDRVPRLVLLPLHRPHAPWHARHQRVDAPLRAADVRLRLPADRPLSEPVGRTDRVATTPALRATRRSRTARGRGRAACSVRTLGLAPWLRATRSQRTAESEPVTARFGPRLSPIRRAREWAGVFAESSIAAGRLLIAIAAIAPVAAVCQRSNELTRCSGPCHQRPERADRDGEQEEADEHARVGGREHAARAGCGRGARRRRRRSAPAAPARRERARGRSRAATPAAPRPTWARAGSGAGPAGAPSGAPERDRSGSASS